MLDTILSYCTTRIFEPSMLLQNIVTAASTLLLFYPAQELPNRKKLLVHFMVLFWGLVLLNTGWEIVFDGPGSYYLTHLALLLGYAAWLGKLERFSYLTTVIDFYAVEIATISLSSVFPYMLENTPGGDQTEILFRNMTVLFTLLVALFFRRCSLLRFRNVSGVSVGYSALVCASTLAISLLYFFQRSNLNVYGHVVSLAAFISVLVISMVAYYLSYSTSSHQEREKQLVIENYSMQSYRDMLRLNQQNIEDMRRIRHDMKNHFSCVGALLEQGDYDKAAAYFDKLKQSTAQALSSIDCGNACLNAVLNLESRKARAYGVTMDCRVMAAPELPIEDDALCALLTNLIDNAIEAIQRQKLADGVVNVGINQRDGQLYISVRNTVAADIDKEVLLSLKTTKQDQQLHGYGHKIVTDIVEHYGGMLNRSVQDGQYTVDIVLNLV